MMDLTSSLLAYDEVLAEAKREGREPNTADRMHAMRAAIEAHENDRKQQANVAPPFAAPASQLDAAALPARRFANVTGFWDADYIEFAAGCTHGGGVLNGVPHESKHYTRPEAERYVREGAWREIAVPLAVDKMSTAGSAKGGITSPQEPANG